MTRIRFALPVIVAMAATFAIVASGSAREDSAGSIAGGPSFDLSWNTIDSGGGESTNGAYTLAGTIGQHDALSAMMVGAGYELAGGFWPGGGPVVVPPPTCRADIAPPPNGNGIVNVDDLLAVINGWGPCPAPPAGCIADIAPPPYGNGLVNVDDLLAIINSWGSCP